MIRIDAMLLFVILLFVAFAFYFVGIRTGRMVERDVWRERQWLLNKQKNDSTK